MEVRGESEPLVKRTNNASSTCGIPPCNSGFLRETDHRRRFYFVSESNTQFAMIYKTQSSHCAKNQGTIETRRSSISNGLSGFELLITGKVAFARQPYRVRADECKRAYMQVGCGLQARGLMWVDTVYLLVRVHLCLFCDSKAALCSDAGKGRRCTTSAREVGSDMSIESH